MMNYTAKLVLTATLMCSLSSTLNAQRYTFQSLDLPEAVEAYAHDINDDNVVVGTFVEVFDGEVFTDGFVWDGGEFAFPFFEVFEASFNGINDSGTIVGAGISLDEFLFPSFVAQGEEVTLFEFPDAFFTLADGVNNDGEIVGQFVGDIEEEVFRSFHRSASGETVELAFEGYPDVVAADINNLGQIVGGVYDDEIFGSGFIYADEELQIFNHPDGDTQLVAINDHGALAGYVDDGEALRAFVFDDGEFHDVEFPGASDTIAWSINNHGVLAGEYMLPGEDFYRAFVAFPVPEPNSQILTLMAALLVGAFCRTRVSV